ncbi:MAG: hypothetical protein WKF92_03840 [Pyrinomonadaceae bacterium]
MNGKCIDIGTIQAFLDGETAPAVSLAVTSHVADCQACALLMADAEEESSLVFSALDREFNTLVPTQRLWSKINESIEVEKSHTPFWEKLRNSLSVLAANPSMTVAASVLIVFTLFAAIWTLNSSMPADIPIAANGPEKAVRKQSQKSLNTAAVGREFIADPVQVNTNNRTEKDRFVATKASFMEIDRPRVQPVGYSKTPAAPELLPGEESYVKTIADLKQNIDGEKDSVLPPASRVAYERDMAVVDDAISKMKTVVRKNPNNQSAKQILYSSYQNKIDLLNSVAQREELMAMK